MHTEVPMLCSRGVVHADVLTIGTMLKTTAMTNTSGYTSMEHSVTLVTEPLVACPIVALLRETL